MDSRLAKRKFVLAVRRANGSTSLEPLQSERAGAVVLFGQGLDILDQERVLAGAEEILGGFLEADNEDAQDGHDENQRASGKHGISPAPVVCLVARTVLQTVPFRGDEEAPGNEAADGLSEAPPGSHEGDEPLLVAGKIFEEDGGVHDQVAPAAETKEGNEEGQAGPAGHGTGDDAGNGADEERYVECIFAANDISAESPEDGTGKHAGVDGNGKGVFIAMRAEFLVGGA